MKSLLNLIDFFSQKPELMYGTDNCFSNYFSQFISILVLLLTSIINKDQFHDWIYQLNPQVTSELSYEYNYKIPFSSPHNRIKFSFEKINLDTLDIKYVSPLEYIHPSYIMMNITNTNITGVFQEKLEEAINDIPYLQMKESVLWNENRNDLNMNLVILPIFYGSLKKIMENQKSNIFMLNIESQKTILNLNFAKKPYNLTTLKSRIAVTSKESKLHRVSFRRETIEVQGSYFWNVTRSYEFNTLNEVIELGSVALEMVDDNNKILAVLFEFSPDHLTTKIVYIDEAGLISSFGGTLGLLTLFGQFLTGFVTSFSLQAFQLNSLFNFYLNDESVNTKKLGLIIRNLSDSNYSNQANRISELIERIQPNKKKYALSSLDIFSAAVEKMFSRSSVKSKNISAALKLQQQFSNYFDLNRLILFYYNLKKIVFENGESCYSEFPDINLLSDSANGRKCFDMPTGNAVISDLKNEPGFLKNINCFQERLKFMLLQNLGHSFT